MQYRDLKKQYQVLKPRIDDALNEVLNECNFISGNQVKELEKRLAEYVGVKHCISCANGTDAIRLALMACGIGYGDAVFVPDFTFFASAEMPAALGATPVFVDVDAHSYNIDVKKLEEAIIQVEKEGILHPQAIVGVNLFGQCADYYAIEAIAIKHNLYIIEDAAQSFGGKIEDRRSCSFGDIATTSFFPSKPLGCYGDGGAVFTDNDVAAALIRSYAIHGRGSDKYDNVRIGLNSRLDTLQAAILNVKLDAFENKELEAVNRIAEMYTEELKEIVITPQLKRGYYSSWAQYTIQLNSKDERDYMQNSLAEYEIPTMIFYPKGMHRQLAFKEINQYGTLTTTERLCDTVLSIPIHPYMSEEDVFTVVSAIKECLLNYAASKNTMNKKLYMV